MENVGHEGDIRILKESLAVVWRQSWREERLELWKPLKSDCRRSDVCSDGSSGCRAEELHGDFY